MQFSNTADKIVLPSQECYNVMQDRKGYLWIGTEQGLCRYSGNEVITFDATNGLPEGAVYAIAEDTSGNLWMATSKNRILVYKNGKLSEAPFSRQYQSECGGFDITYMLFFSDDGLLYINSQKHSWVVNTATNKLTKAVGTASDEFSILLKDKRLVPFNAAYTPKVISTKTISDTKVNLKDHKGLLKQIRIPKNDLHVPARIIVEQHATDFFAVDNKLVRLTKELKYEVYEMPQRILSIYTDNQGDLWVGVLKQGVYYFPKGNLKGKPVVSLNSYSVSGILEDAESNIWCTTLEKGLFMCRNKNVINYFNVPGLDKPADMMKSIDGDTYFSTVTDRIVKIRENHVSTIAVKTFSKEPVCDILKSGHDWYISGQELLFRTKDFTSGTYLKKQSGSRIGITQMAVFDGRLYGINNSNFFKVVGNDIQSVVDFSSRGRCLEALNDGRFLCGCNDGLYVVNPFEKTIKKISGINHAVTRIINTHGKIWITTKGEGLYAYHQGKVTRMMADILDTSLLYDVVATGNTLWLASNKGLIKITLQNNAIGYESYTVLNGLPSNDIYKLSVSNDRLLLSTVEGICAIPLSANLMNVNPPPIYLKSVSINGELQDIHNRKLKYDSNSIKLVFDAPAFKSGHTRLYYRLEGRGDHYLTTSGNELMLDNLAPGSYNLIVYGLNSDSVRSVKPIQITFEILNPFWLTWWFVALCVAMLFCTIYWLVKNNIRKIKRREEEKTRITELVAQSQLSALQAQMNPHFIFNSINSIQSYILMKKEKEAYGYLAQFSKLIRMVLNNSQQKLLSLRDEIELIKLYVELEQMRLNDSFSFELIIDKDINLLKTQIPPMIIQPYIENAIWHGITNLEGQRKGLVRLKIESEKDLIRIILEDNGIGRVLSKTYQNKKKYRPVAMHLNQERLSIVNTLHKGNEITVTVEDLYDEAGIPTGTKVTITLPN